MGMNGGIPGTAARYRMRNPNKNISGTRFPVHILYSSLKIRFPVHILYSSLKIHVHEINHDKFLHFLCSGPS